MANVPLSDWLLERLDRRSPDPMYRQLHQLLLQAILHGRLSAGSKLPSSRLLARELGIARNTVAEVYEHLEAQGCLTSRHGSGTFAADLSMDKIVGSQLSAAGLGENNSSDSPLRMSKRGDELLKGAGFSSRQWGAFMSGVPDVTEFPTKIWTRLHNRHWRRPSPQRLSYAPAGGLPALRTAVANHLRDARSVRCSAEQVVITTGTHQSVDLAARLLTDPGDQAWVEEPCYWGVRSTLRSAGVITQPVRVDEEGLQWSELHDLPAPNLICVTPSHQYPLGMVMSLARRQALLDYCRQHGSWIIEDDYDGEFRYGTRPIACLQGLDTNGLVIYVGSFSKPLFPGLRLGYVVVPTVLAEAFARGSAELYREGQLQQQAMMADFIKEGHLASHIRRMRKLYSQRRHCLLEAVQSEFDKKLEVLGDNAGLHLVLRLPDTVDDEAIVLAAQEMGIVVRSLSRYYTNPQSAQRGLLLGYASVKEEDIGPMFKRLAQVLRQHGL